MSKCRIRGPWYQTGAHTCTYERYAVFERYAEFFLAETAPPQPLGPKGEVYFVSAGKI